MYSVVLATMLTVGGATADWHRCYSSCYGCSCSCYAYRSHGFHFSAGFGMSFGHGYCSSCYCSSYCSGCYCSRYYCSSCYCSSCYCSSYCSSCYCSSYCSSCYYSSCYCSSCYCCSATVVVPVQPVIVVPTVPQVVYTQPQVVVQSPPQVVVQQSPPVVQTPVPQAVPAPVVPAPTAGEIQALRQEVERLRDIIRRSPSSREEEVVAGNQARVTVTLPSDARLWIDSVECPLTSSVRTITTPALDPNQRYSYTLKMEVVRNGRTLSQTQRVQLVPGETVRVEFNSASLVVSR